MNIPKTPLVLILIALLTAPVFAQDRQPDYWMGFRFQGEESDNSFDENGGGLGVFFGWYLSDKLVLEASYDHIEADLIDFGRYIDWLRDDDRTTDIYSVGVNYMPISSLFRPYLTGGFSYASAEYTFYLPIDAVEVNSDHDFAPYLGFGFEFLGRPYRKGFSIAWENRWTFFEGEDFIGFNTSSLDRTYTSSLNFKWRF